MKKPGMRNIKTAISVVIGAAIIKAINLAFNTNFEYFYTCITSVFCMQKTEYLSKDKSKDRILGTFIGAIIALVLGFLRFNIIPFKIDLIFLFIGIVCAISIIDHMKLKAGVMIACIMVIASFKDLEHSYVAYTIFRGFETILGAYIALYVNKYIYPYSEDEEKLDIKEDIK